MPKRKSSRKNSTRNRQLRLRLFDAGNTKCPICLATFNRSDVIAGHVTLEHAPPASLYGSAVCLTCKKCNSNASRLDQQALLSKTRSDDWSAGRGSPVEVDFFGRRISSRYIPDDPNSPLPLRARDLRKGSISLGARLLSEQLDFSKGIRFRISIIPHYERISLLKSAYLMVFALLGRGGYSFAENIALKPIREQIMNPDASTLKGNFFLKGNFEQLLETDKRIVSLYKPAPACWMIPLWNNHIVVLPCGGPEPIDEFVFPIESFSIPTDLFSFWVSCSFDSSAPLVGSVNEEAHAGQASLVGFVNRDPAIAATGDKWRWMVVYHHILRYVALPCGDPDRGRQLGVVDAVQMLNENMVVGSGMDRSTLAGVSFKELSKERSISAINKENQPRNLHASD